MLACSDPGELEQLESTWDPTASGLPQDLTEVSDTHWLAEHASLRRANCYWTLRTDAWSAL